METHVSMNAILYIARSGNRWQVLARDAPPWQAAYLQYRRIARQSFFRGGAGASIIGDPGRFGRPRTGRKPS
jgi:transposase